MPMRLEATKLSLKVRRAVEVHLLNHEALTSRKAGAISIQMLHNSTTMHSRIPLGNGLLVRR
jgi:hypothetical protein